MKSFIFVSLLYLIPFNTMAYITPMVFKVILNSKDSTYQFVFYHFGTHKFDKILQNCESDSNNTFTIKNCYYEKGLMSAFGKFDTISLGKLSTNNYKVFFILSSYQFIELNNCNNPAITDTTTHYFTINKDYSITNNDPMTKPLGNQSDTLRYIEYTNLLRTTEK